MPSQRTPSSRRRSDGSAARTPAAKRTGTTPPDGDEAATSPVSAPASNRKEAPTEDVLAMLLSRLEKAERAALALERRAAKLELAWADSKEFAPAPIHARGEPLAPRTARKADAASAVVRCPGCRLAAREPAPRCAYCGFLFSVLPPSRRPGHRPAARAKDRKRS